jgi:succinate dehydrogenase / fumarate reductase flavoprotein subunit
MYEQFHALASVDITKEPMEVGPTIHYTMGGVRVAPETGATTVPGLYAAGEVSGGLHGANRLGGNSLGDILVFGKRAGEAAAAEAAGRAHAAVDERQVEAEQRALLTFLDPHEEGENPYLLHEALQEAMQDDAGIARTEESLTRSLHAIQELCERAPRMRVGGSRILNPGWHTCRDVVNMLVISEAIVRSALERRESRGSQWRLDFPDPSEEQGRVNYVTYDGGDGMRIRALPRAPVPPHLQRLIDDELALRAVTTIPVRPDQRIEGPAVATAGREA